MPANEIRATPGTETDPSPAFAEMAKEDGGRAWFLSMPIGCDPKGLPADGLSMYQRPVGARYEDVKLKGRWWPS